MSESVTVAEEQVEKWRAPAMSGDANKIMRHRAEQQPSMPTVKDIDQWRSEAEEEGYQQGLAKAQLETRDLQQQLVQLINFFERPLQAMNEDIEQQLMQLAVTLAQQLVRREIKQEPGEIVGVIRDSVKLLPGMSRNITIVLHPEDARLVRSALSIEGSDEEHSWQLVEDPMLTRGGCEIKAGSSAINATLENRLSALAASVLGGERELD